MRVSRIFGAHVRLTVVLLYRLKVIAKVNVETLEISDLCELVDVM